MNLGSCAICRRREGFLLSRDLAVVGHTGWTSNRNLKIGEEGFLERRALGSGVLGLIGCLIRTF